MRGENPAHHAVRREPAANLRPPLDRILAFFLSRRLHVLFGQDSGENPRVLLQVGALQPVEVQADAAVLRFPE